MEKNMEKKTLINYGREEWNDVAAAYNSLLKLEVEVIPNSYAHREMRRIENLLLEAMHKSGKFTEEIERTGPCMYEVK